MTPLTPLTDLPPVPPKLRLAEIDRELARLVEIDAAFVKLIAQVHADHYPTKEMISELKLERDALLKQV